MYMPELTRHGLQAVEGGNILLESISVAVVFRDLLAETVLTQVYRNRETVPVEAVYTFPLASQAVLLDLTVCIGGRHLQGVVVAKPAAEEHYEQAIAEGDTAIMLEQVQPGLYTMNVGNILAGEEVRLTLRSAELLAWQDNRLRFRLPTTIAPRYGSAEEAGLQPHQVPEHDLFAEHRLQIRARLHGPMAKAKVASPTHPIVIDQLPTETVVALAPGHMALDRDFILYIDRAADQHSVLVEREGEGGYVALASFVPQMPTSASLPPKNIKIMVDCSGSMAGDAITQARQAISDILQHLRPEDFFNIVAFGSDARAFFAQQVPATAKNITAVRRQLRSLEADMGGTEMGEALQLAIHLAGSTLPPDMLLITDGQIWEFASLMQMARDSGHRVFTVGVGSAVAEPFVRCLARETGGACELVTPNEDMAATIVRHFKRIMLPHTEDVSVQWPVEPVQRIPEELGQVFAGDTIHAFARFREQPSGPVTLTLSLADGRSCVETVTIPADALADDEAVAAPGPLLRTAMWHALQAEDEATATEMAVRYQLLTSLANFLVVAERTENDRCTELPLLRKVPQMVAAGWGGTGTVLQEPILHLRKPASPKAASRPDIRFSIASPIDWRQRTSPERFLQRCGWRHTKWLLPVLKVKSYGDLVACDLPDRILDALQAIASAHAPKASESMVVLAFLQALAMSPAQLEFPRTFRRALRKSMKKTPPDERLLAAMSVAFAGISADDWGPEYPFIEEDEESDNANS